MLAGTYTGTCYRSTSLLACVFADTTCFSAVMLAVSQLRLEPAPIQNKRVRLPLPQLRPACAPSPSSKRLCPVLPPRHWVREQRAVLLRQPGTEHSGHCVRRGQAAGACGVCAGGVLASVLLPGGCFRHCCCQVWPCVRVLASTASPPPRPPPLHPSWALRPSPLRALCPAHCRHHAGVLRPEVGGVHRARGGGGGRVCLQPHMLKKNPIVTNVFRFGCKFKKDVLVFASIADINSIVRKI